MQRILFLKRFDKFQTDKGLINLFERESKEIEIVTTKDRSKSKKEGWQDRRRISKRLVSFREELYLFEIKFAPGGKQIRVALKAGPDTPKIRFVKKKNNKTGGRFEHLNFIQDRKLFCGHLIELLFLLFFFFFLLSRPFRWITSWLNFSFFLSGGYSSPFVNGKFRS